MTKAEVLTFIEKQFRLPTGFDWQETPVRSKTLKRMGTAHVATKSTLYIDVTDTDSCPIITGIQRVVRQLAHCFIENKISCKLIRYDFDTDGFVVLTEEEEEIFFNRSKPNALYKSRSWHSILNDALYSVLKEFGRYISAQLYSLGRIGFFAELRDGAEFSKPGLVRKN